MGLYYLSAEMKVPTSYCLQIIQVRYWGNSLQPGLSTWPLLAWMGVEPQPFLLYLPVVSCYCLKIFCLAGLPLSCYFGQRNRGFFWGGVVCEPTASFFSSKLGINEGKRKPREHAIVLVLMSRGPWLVCLLVSVFQSHVMYVIYILFGTFSCISGIREMYTCSVFLEADVFIPQVLICFLQFQIFSNFYCDLFFGL